MTPIQELIEKLEKFKDSAKGTSDSFNAIGMSTAALCSDAMSTAYEFAIKEATLLIEKEKKIIIDAYDGVYEDVVVSNMICAEDYYERLK